MTGGEDFIVRFWGVRGSYPTPGPRTVRHGGNTSCIEVQVGGRTLILDAGSGIIRLGNDLLQRSDEPLEVSLLITHGHGDHLLGFPFFAPLFERRATVHIFGPRLTGKTVEQLVTPYMSPPYFPVDLKKLPSHRTFHTLAEGESVIWEQGQCTPEVVDGDERHGEHGQSGCDPEVRVLARYTTSHPLDGSVIYRIEYAGRSVVYSTDVEWKNSYDPDCVAITQGADLLIHDAQYTSSDYETKRGFGHSTIEMATGMARAAGVGELILFHHEPTYDDDKLDQMEAEARKQFAHTRSAFEGMEIDLLAPKTERKER
ncbi:MAG TPA: MBL fold metallo-hydrolase [Ktedonobacteraceae bacterium]|nr:MBL fold metallo-hydrolase [Ktedonobacteraceae bacterium]